MSIESHSHLTRSLETCEALCSISEHIEPEKMSAALLRAVTGHIGARQCCLLLRDRDRLWKVAEMQWEGADPGVRVYPECMRSAEGLPASILEQVLESRSPVVLDDAALPNLFFADVGLRNRNARSVACLPLAGQGEVIGLLYMEHALAPGIFTPEALTLARLFVAQFVLVFGHAQRQRQLLEENERLRAVDRSLVFQRNLLRTLADSMPHRIYAKDTDSRFTFGNMAVAKGMGVSHPDELLGETDFGFYPEECAAQYMAEERQIMHSGEPLVDHEERVNYLLTDDEAWMLTNKVPLRDDAGRVIGIVGINYNITERKRMELELLQRNNELTALATKLAQAQQQLVQSEKLASIGQLAAGVAHEINNPIGYIFSNFHTLSRYLENLFEMLAAYEEAEKSIDAPLVRDKLDALRNRTDLAFLKEDIPALMCECREGIVRVQKIVQDLKDFSHADQQHEWHPSDLHRGIDAAVNIIQSEVRDKADIVKEYGDIPEVECLSSEISQVIMNLVINAAHAVESEAPGRGTITIRTGVRDGGVWIEVADNGCGIQEENRSRIFDPFFTTKPVGKGTGLGLSLAYGIVQKHQGCIEVESVVGKGTTFRISLPLRQTPAQVVDSSVIEAST